MDEAPLVYDLAVAWVWQYDLEFVGILEEAAREENLTTFRVERHNAAQFFEALKKRTVGVRAFLDRASDEDEAFQPLARYIAQYRSDIRVINPHHLQNRAADKATMHLEFHAHGINVPYTIIISPYSQKQEPELSLSELAKLGRPFIIKPANTTGGGVGVVLGAETLKDVLDARQHHRNDKYLLQETIKPVYLSENRAWFRVFFALGNVYPCWWDDQTHTYELLTEEDEAAFDLGGLRDITRAIHEISALDFFSTEIVYTARNIFVVVDYVNEICDMRLQSLHRDGVPDSLVRHIGRAMARFVRSLPASDSP